MAILYEAPRLLTGIHVPEYFVTDIGKVETLTPSVIALLICQEDDQGLTPAARMLWPVERFMTTNSQIGGVVRSKLLRIVS